MLFRDTGAAQCNDNTKPVKPLNVQTAELVYYIYIYIYDGPGSNPGGDEIFARPDRPWGLPSLLYNGYRVFPGGKVRPGRAADHSRPSGAAVMEE